MDELFRLALEEDIGKGDITSENIFTENKKTSATIFSKDEGVICGVEIAKKIFSIVDKDITVENFLKDGDIISKGDKIMVVSGQVISLLSAERTVLNFLQRLSGVSTLTRKFVDKVRPYGVRILDTRKTIPGWRELQKYAVKVGGGENHRKGLYDMVLIKENHIAVAGGVKEAVSKVKHLKKEGIIVEVEVESLDQVRQALETEADWIMLDNMKYDEMKEAVKIIDHKKKVEASGGVNLSNVEETAKCGVDFISVGALTHSFKPIDLSMRVEFKIPL